MLPEWGARRCVGEATRGDAHQLEGTPAAEDGSVLEAPSAGDHPPDCPRFPHHQAAHSAVIRWSSSTKQASRRSEGERGRKSAPSLLVVSRLSEFNDTLKES